MSLEDKNIAVNTITVQYLMLCKDQTDGLERMAGFMKVSNPDISDNLDLMINHMRVLERFARKTAEENAEITDRYTAFLNRIEHLTKPE